MSTRPLHIPLFVLLLLGCPGFEDDLSGTYQQIVDDEATTDELVALDVFRAGDSVQAVVRYYAPTVTGAKPFEVENSCQTTVTAPLADDLSFELFYGSGTGRARITGRFDGGSTLAARINFPDETTSDLEFTRIDSEPVPDCSTIEPKRFDAQFSLSGTGANEFKPKVYEMVAPHFGVQWVPVLKQQTSGGLQTFFGGRPDLISTPITSNLSVNRRGLSGSLSLVLEAPPNDQKSRTPSGDTTFSLAHFIVVDDKSQDEALVWDRSTEPIVAAGVRKGNRENPPPGAEDHNRFGRAILFVSDRLDDLDPALLDQMEGWENVDPEAHFWVVEIFSFNERVRGLRFLPDTTREIAVIVTPDYLADTDLNLPRLFPEK